MRVSELMTKGPVTVKATETLKQAAFLMAERDLGILPVVAEDDPKRILGTLTDRDITILGVAKGLDPNQALAKEAMTPEVIDCAPDTEIEDAAKLMAERKVRRLVVKDGDRIAGIVSLGDLANHLNEPALVSKTLEGVS